MPIPDAIIGPTPGPVTAVPPKLIAVPPVVASADEAINKIGMDKMVRNFTIRNEGRCVNSNKMIEMMMMITTI